MNKIVLEELNSYVKLVDNEYIIKKENKSVTFDVKEDSEVVLNICNEKDINTNYIINIEKNTNLYINIFDASKKIYRDITININGENSKAVLNISSISLDQNNYKINVYHNCKNTSSNTNIHGLTLNNNSININNNGYIRKGSSCSKLIQDNKIIIMNENNSKIEPNLYIDEYDIEASHGAYIGKFDEEELFYLNSRGLDNKNSYNLLINGFLLYDFYMSNDEKDEIKKIIKKYWG